MAETVTSVEFRNYKALRNFSLSLGKRNILVGPNNCGKSTIIGAFRVLSEGVRMARSKSPDMVWVEGTRMRGYQIPSESIAISTENVHTNYEDVDSSVTFRLSNGNRLRLVFRKEGGCVMLPEADRTYIGSPSSFKSAFPVTFAVVPVLGPLEHDEPSVKPATVQRNLHTTRASRHFRNYWRYYPEGFARFSELVSRTWPGTEISPPVDDGDVIHMFCSEERIPRELYWSGFGFQVWCQLLTHLDRGRDASLVVVDEPEIYLHPELQRELLDILFSLGPTIVLATHSAELIGPAAPKDVLLIDKKMRSAHRLVSENSIQEALDAIGSVHNVTLSRIARHRRVLFVEGKDRPLLLKFANIAGLKELAAGTELPIVRSDGFNNWTRIRDTAWGIRKVLGGPFLMASLLDRDYRPLEQVRDIVGQLGSEITLALVLERKEIENYLLVPAAICSAVNALLRKTRGPKENPSHPCLLQEIVKVLSEITDSMENQVRSQYLAKRSAYLRETGDKRDDATVIRETSDWFDECWETLDGRMVLAPGKEVLARLRQWVQQTHGVTLSTASITNQMKVTDIAQDMTRLLQDLNQFRTALPD